MGVSWALYGRAVRGMRLLEVLIGLASYQMTID